MKRNFDWYEEIRSSNEITQGDILVGCNIPIPNISIYNAIIDGNENPEDPIEIKLADLVILSQACDIENEKINSLVLCPIWPLSKLKGESKYYLSTKARESLRKGNEP